MKQLAWLCVAAILISGCSGDEDAVKAPACDELTHFVDAMGECVPHVEPTMVVTGLPATMQQFGSADFTWALDNGTRHEVHSMDSRILANTENSPVTNETGPDAWGTQVAIQKHKDFPDSFEATFTWDSVGTVHLKGYMLINAKNVWVDLGSIDVGNVTATANRTTITIAGTPPAVDDTEVGITVGDGVVLDNQLDYPLTLSWACTNGVTPAGQEIPAGESAQFDFLALTSCTYTLNSPVAVVPVDDPLATTGKVVVSRP